MAEQDYQVQDPSGAIRVIRGPAGASDEEVIAQAQSLFGSTPGGAAVGNPNIQRQGDAAARPKAKLGEAAAKIGGAGAMGGILGWAAPELLMGAGGLAAAIPGGQPVAPWLIGAGQVLRGQRLASAAAGAIAGVAGETAGQAVEAAGGPQWLAEGARFVGGGSTPEMIQGAKWVLQKYVQTPALSIISKFKKEVGKGLLGQLENGKKDLSAAEREYLDQLVGELRGGGTESDLIGVGNRMGAEAAWQSAKAGETMAGADMIRQAVGRPTPAADREYSQIGDDLRGIITKRNEGMLSQRRAEYAATEQQRDQLVQGREAAGQYVNQTPEYTALLDSLKAELKPGVRSESVQAGIRKIVSELESGGTVQGEKRLVQSGQNLDLVQGPSKAGPITFQALDDVRRKLGDAFRGKPAEGYDAIGEVMAKDLYGKISDIQKNYAGGANGPQAKLLDDYAARTEGLQVFRSKSGKRATALDQYDDSQFVNDASALPKAYFKTRDSVRALKQLTGDETAVNKAAAEYATRELAGKDGPQTRSWMQKNSDWLQETPLIRRMVDEYAGRLEGAERSMRNAQDFAAAAAKDTSLLTRNALPAQRAVDLIKSGDMELWSRAGPAIAQSPQAKQEVMGAARRILAEQATAKGTTTFYERNLRPFLENANITNKAELDYIAERLAQIKDLKVPEQERLGIMKRFILQSLGGMAASVASRGGVNAYQWTKEHLVPQ